MAHRVDALCLCFPVAIRWHDDSSRTIGQIDCVGYVELIECVTCARIEEMNSLREVIVALFHRKFAVPKEFRLVNKGIARGTIYVGIRICMISF